MGSLLTVFFRSGVPRNWAEAGTSDRDAYARFFGAMLDDGVLLAPSQFEAWFISAAHGEAEVAETLDGRAQGVRRMTAAERPSRATSAPRAGCPSTPPRSGSCARPAVRCRSTAGSASTRR